MTEHKTKGVGILNEIFVVELSWVLDWNVGYSDLTSLLRRQWTTLREVIAQQGCAEICTLESK